MVRMLNRQKRGDGEGAEEQVDLFGKDVLSDGQAGDREELILSRTHR